MRKLYDGGIGIVLVFVLIVAAGGYISSKFLGDDNVVEEVSESIIENQMDLPAGSLDLTPLSPEKE